VYNIETMKKLNQHLLLLLFVLICNLSFGQNNMEDVVYLKNGSVIRGIIIEQIPNQSIKIQTKDRNVFVFKYDDIEKITKENPPLDYSNNNSKVTDFKKSGFINQTEINYSPGIGLIEYGNNSIRNSINFIGFRTVNGYQLNQHFSFGIGIGIDNYKDETFLPVTADIRMTLLKGKASPVFTWNVGYAVGLNNIQGGVIFNPQIGIKTFISKNVAYLFNLGYKSLGQEITYIDGYIFQPPAPTPRFVTENINFKFITISTGFSF
jgi:hypothetical protein